MAQRSVRRARLFVATLAVVGMVTAAAVPGLAAASRSGTLKRSSSLERSSQREIASNTTAKEGDGGDAEGAAEIQEGANQWAEPRFGPAGALSHAVADARRLPVVGGPWSEVTTKPYNADDLNFADPVISNAGGGGPGPGWVTGRMTALALDGHTVFAGGADGGVWRSTDGGDHWTPLTDFLPTTSIGSLAVNPVDHSVWVGTGESNTSSDSFMGMGVYRSTDDGNTWKHVGGKEIDHQMIGHLTFDGEGKLYAAASNGVWRRSAGGSLTKKWSLVLRPGTPGPYGFTFANDVQVKPHTNGKTVIANVAWRGGYTDYNGFYESTDGGNTWHMVQTKGINAAQIGRSSFAYASNGRLYAVVESIHKYLFNPETALMGIYFSPSGNVAGPWRLGAGSKELGNSPNNALGFGFGYSPGIQTWYDQLVGVDPDRPNHVYVGLEEVFESTNGGQRWVTVGPYWNFGLDCYVAGGPTNCPPTTHPDQHAIAFGGGRVWLGNDGGIYSRGLRGDSWSSHNADLRTLQYYYGGAGALSGGALGYWGGLQDNGGSFLRTNTSTMVSPFGGDGGDVIVDPNNANRTVQEYVGLDMFLTTNGGRSDGSTSAWREISPACGAFTYTPNPCDPSPRFIAPFTADVKDVNGHWVAGGRYVWDSTKGWGTHCSASACDWKIVHDTGEASSITALAVNGSTTYAGYCGNGCNPADVFYAGIDTNYGGTWHTVAGPGMHNGGDQLPQRVIANMVVDPADAGHVYAIYSGYSRRWIPGGGVGHVFESKDGGATWKDISGNLPDAPGDDLVMSGGKLVVSMDVGVFVTSENAPGKWSRYGRALPHAVPNDLFTTPDGDIVTATHGRGMWQIGAP